MVYEIKVKDLPLRHTLTIRTRSSVQNLPNAIGESYRAIMELMGDLGENPTGMPFVIYYNMDMNDLDVEIGFPVSKKLSGKDNVKSSKIPAGKFASTMHIGPYDKVELAYNQMTQWIKDKGHEAAGAVIEFYYNNPEEVGMENAQTEIQFALK